MKYEFWDDFIVEGREDYVGIWQIINRLNEKFSQSSPKEILLMAIQAVREILETGFIQIGMFEYIDEKNLEDQIWNQYIDSIINPIETEWDKLPREPNIGDIAWLIITKTG